MRTRGLLVAAAILQLVGAALFAASGTSLLVMGGHAHQGRPAPFFLSGAVALGAALAFAVISIALLRGRRWAWLASLALCGAAALIYLAFSIALPKPELAMVIAPILLTIGLLVGGRHAVP